MKQFLVVLVTLLLVLGGAFWWLVGEAGTEEERLLVYCAAGFREPMTEVARRYEEKYRVEVHLQFGGSGALASQLEVAGGDLFLPADKSYLEPFRESGELRGSLELIRLEAGMVVPVGNPEGLRTLQDLRRVGLKLSFGERSASIGKHTLSVLEEVGLWAKVEANVVVTKPTVNNVVEDVVTGAVDAAIAWDGVAQGFSRVEWIPVPEFARRALRADLGVLKSSEQVERAFHFARYVVDPEGGRKVFEEMGFTCSE